MLKNPENTDDPRELIPLTVAHQILLPEILCE